LSNYYFFQAKKHEEAVKQMIGEMPSGVPHNNRYGVRTQTETNENDEESDDDEQEEEEEDGGETNT
jgi:hypothetical protein